jgi:hypothetical protein
VLRDANWSLLVERQLLVKLAECNHSTDLDLLKGSIEKPQALQRLFWLTGDTLFSKDEGNKTFLEQKSNKQGLLERNSAQPFSHGR